MFSFFKEQKRFLTGLLSSVSLFLLLFSSLNFISTQAFYQADLDAQQDYFRVRIREIKGTNQEGQEVARVLVLEGSQEGRVLDAVFDNSQNFEADQVVIAQLNQENQIILEKSYNLDFLYISLFFSAILFLFFTFIKGIFVSLSWTAIILISYYFYSFFGFTEFNWQSWLWLFISGLLLQLSHLKLNLKLLASFFVWVIVSVLITGLNYLTVDFLNLTELNLDSSILAIFPLVLSFVSFYFYLNLSQIVTKSEKSDISLVQTFKHDFKPIRNQNIQIVSLFSGLLLILNLPLLNPENSQISPWLFFSLPQLYLSLAAVIMLILNLFIINFLAWLLLYFSCNFKQVFRSNKKTEEVKPSENLFKPKPKLESLEDLENLESQEKEVEIEPDFDFESKPQPEVDNFQARLKTDLKDTKEKLKNSAKKSKEQDPYWLSNLQTLQELEAEQQELEKNIEKTESKKPEELNQPLNQQKKSERKIQRTPEEELLERFKIQPNTNFQEQNKNKFKHPSQRALEKRDISKISQQAEKIRGIKKPKETIQKNRNLEIKLEKDLKNQTLKSVTDLNHTQNLLNRQTVEKKETKSPTLVVKTQTKQKQKTKKVML